MKFTITVEIDANNATEALSMLVNGNAASVLAATQTVKPAAAKPAAAPAAAATAPAATPTPLAPAPAPAPAPAAAAGLTDAEMRAVLSPLMTGANVPIKASITALINKYAPTLSGVPADKRAELLAAARAIGAEFDATGVVPA